MLPHCQLDGPPRRFAMAGRHGIEVQTLRTWQLRVLHVRVGAGLQQAKLQQWPLVPRLASLDTQCNDCSQVVSVKVSVAYPGMCRFC